MSFVLWNIHNYIHHFDFNRYGFLALQLHFLLDMALLRDCLMCPSPKRPRDNLSRLY